MMMTPEQAAKFQAEHAGKNGATVIVGKPMVVTQRQQRAVATAAKNNKIGVVTARNASPRSVTKAFKPSVSSPRDKATSSQSSPTTKAKSYANVKTRTTTSPTSIATGRSSVSSLRNKFGG